MRRIYPIISLFLLLLLPCVAGNVSFINFDVSKDMQGETSRISLELSAANRADEVRGELTAVARLVRESDSSEINRVSKEFALAERGVEDISLQLEMSDNIANGDYKLIGELRDPAGKPLATMYETIEITSGSSGTVRFETAPHVQIVTEEDGVRRTEASYGDEGEKISKGSTANLVFGVENTYGSSVDASTRIRLTGAYSGEEVTTISRDLGTLDSGEIEGIEIPLERQDPGTYKATVVVLADGKEVASRNVRVVFAGDSANILEVTNAKDTYEEGEQVTLQAVMIGPADGVGRIPDAYLSAEVRKDGDTVKQIEHDGLELGFTRMTEEFTFEAPEALDEYTVGFKLGKGDRVYDEAQITYENITNDRRISGDGRVYDPDEGGCFDDGECTEQELAVGRCFDCRNHPEAKQPPTQEELKEKSGGDGNLAMIAGVLLVIVIIGVGVFMMRKGSKKHLVLLLAFSLMFSVTMGGMTSADPTSNPSPPPTVEQTNSSPAVAYVTECGGNNPEAVEDDDDSEGPVYAEDASGGDSFGLQPGDTYQHCEDGDYKKWTYIKTQGGTVLNKSVWYTCGQNNNSWDSKTVSEEWADCPCGEPLAEKHAPGNLTTGYSSVSYDMPAEGRFTSDYSTDLFFNAYVEACLNRIPMMRMQADLGPQRAEGDSWNPLESKVGLYAKHKTIDYLAENTGKIGEFTFPQQDKFRRQYVVDTELKSYRYWAWRKRFSTGLKQRVDNAGLSIPGDESVDDLSAGMPHTVRREHAQDLYLSEDFMKGGLDVTVGNSGQANAVEEEVEVSPECTLDVYDINLPGVSDDANALEDALQHPTNRSNLIQQIENNPGWCNLTENVTIANVSFAGTEELAIFDDEQNDYYVNISELNLDGISSASELDSFLDFEGNYSAFESSLRDLGEMSADEEIINLSSVSSDHGGAFANVSADVMAPTGSGDVGAKVELRYYVEMKANTSWNWRMLKNVSLDELARCMYNWDACFLDPREGDVPWTMHSVADLGYGTGVNTTTYNWTQQRVDNYSIYYDGARGSEEYQVNVTVYKDCEEGDPWISERGDYACVDGTVHRCWYSISQDTPWVNQSGVGTELFINESQGTGFRCQAPSSQAQIERGDVEVQWIRIN